MWICDMLVDACKGVFMLLLVSTGYEPCRGCGKSIWIGREIGEDEVVSCNECVMNAFN